MINDDWLSEIKNCKKINKNIVIKNSATIVTNNLMEKLNNKNNNIYKEEIIYNYDYEYNYKLEKNKSLGIDRNTDKKLKAGKIKIDLKLDFHGLTLEEAFDSLLKNIEKAYNSGLKLILVITGKGKGTKEGKESIKNLIEKWMKHPVISSRIIKYVDAQQKDGGAGAIYVLLKNKK